jgi:hypothetical protein
MGDLELSNGSYVSARMAALIFFALFLTIIKLCMGSYNFYKQTASIFNN